MEVKDMSDEELDVILKQMVNSGTSGSQWQQAKMEKEKRDSKRSEKRDTTNQNLSKIALGIAVLSLIVSLIALFKN